jgi:hypothetical protein
MYVTLLHMFWCFSANQIDIGYIRALHLRMVQCLVKVAPIQIYLYSISQNHHVVMAEGLDWMACIEDNYGVCILEGKY